MSSALPPCLPDHGVLNLARYAPLTEIASFAGLREGKVPLDTPDCLPPFSRPDAIELYPSPLSCIRDRSDD